MIPKETEAEIFAPVSRREVADRHDRHAAQPASHDGAAGAAAQRRRAEGGCAAPLDGGPVRAVHPRATGEVPRHSRKPDLHHDQGARVFGRPDHLRRIVGRLRPKPTAEAYQRLRTMPGEQAQVDWAHFGKLQVGRAVRPLWAFVMVLSYSRRPFVRFFPGASMPFFLRGHAEAFAEFGGVPRVLLYDNLKSAVLERHGDAIRFNPTLLELAAHYRFEPRPVAIARGNEKGRVERAIRYVREAFFEARTYADLADLNRQAAE